MERRLARFWAPRVPHYHYDYRSMYRPRHHYEQPSMPYSHMDMSHRWQNRHRYRDSDQAMYDTVLNELLELHNYHRARHCAAPLTISRRLNKIAQSYADELAATSKFEHSGNKLGNESLGENLYMQWISIGKVKVSSKAAIKSWYDEISLHDFKRPKFSAATGHFTQMVWKSSKKMGVGVALSPDGREVYFVTNYYPAGNVVGPGTFEKNVLPAKC